MDKDTKRLETTMDFNATATLPRRFDRMSEQEYDDLLECFAAYHPALGAGARGEVEIVLTLPATSLAQAVQTASALLAPLRPVGLEVITTQAWDARVGIAPVPELLSVTEVAQKQGVSRQAVLQRIASGMLPARRVGSAWAIPATAAA